jgi:hypothetical protein
MLQEGLERERKQLENERERAIQHSQEALDRFRQEVELAIAGWKCTMNAEVAKAKEVCEELRKKRRGCLVNLNTYPSDTKYKVTWISTHPQSTIKN